MLAYYAPLMKSTNFKESFVPPLWILTLIVMGGGLWVLYTLKEMVVLLTVSFSVAYILSPVLDWFERRGITRDLSVIIVGIIVLVSIGLAAATTIPTLIREYQLLLENFPKYSESARVRLQPLLEQLMPFLPTPWAEAIRSGSLTSLFSLNENIPKQIVHGLWSTLLSGYNFTLSLLNALIFPFVVYYLAVDYRRIFHGLMQWVPFLQRRHAEQILGEIDAQVSAYVRGQLLVGFLMFLLFALGLGVLQIELWLLVAFISGFGNLVPYVGSIVGVLLATIMALVSYGTITSVLLVWGLYAGVQFLEGTFITPKVIGESVGLSPLVVILAIIGGGSLFGLLGIFLAVPVVAALKVVLKYLHFWVMARAQGSPG